MKTNIKRAIEKVVKEEISKMLLVTELNVYDFDDTLVRTDGTVHLVNTKTKSRRL
jgi:hypothetical protein